MVLRLSSHEIEAFAALEQALLSPRAGGSVDEWCRGVLRRAEAVFRADRSLMLVPAGSRTHYVSESIDCAVLSAAERAVALLKPENLRLADPVADRAWNARRVCAIEVWSLAWVSRLIGVAPEHRPACHDAMRAAGIEWGVAASTMLPTGTAVLGVAWSTPPSVPLDEEGALELMQMVLPAFKAGVHALAGATDGPRSVARVLEALGESLLICDGTGRELQRSKRLSDVLSADPEREFILREMRALAESLTPFFADRPDVPLRTGTVDVATATAQYRARGTYVEAGLFGEAPAVLVTLERLTRELPTAEQLATRHGLTPREAEVAVLLARGLSNREIAAQLSLSRSTVRHHAEWVFRKLGVHSRKALGLTLIGRADDQTR